MNSRDKYLPVPDVDDSGNPLSTAEAIPEGPEIPPELEPGPFPLHALSPCQRSIVEDLTRLHRLPPEMPGLAALAVTGACVGKGAQLVGAVNGRAGNFANLFVFIGAPKSSGKGALGALADPLLTEDRRQREHHQRVQAPALNSQLGNLQARVKFLRTKLAKGPSPSGQGKSTDLEVAEREILECETRIAQIQKDILEPALCVGDATSEALATQVVASPDESMLVYSPEAGDLLRVALGRYRDDRKADCDLLLKGFSVELHSSIRISRGRIDCIPCISVLGFVQPFLLRELFSNPEAFERGLTARILATSCIIEPEEESGSCPSPDAVAREQWRLAIDALLALRFEAAHRGEPFLARCSKEAEEVLRSFHNESIRLRRSVLREISDECGRWREIACRIALGLCLADDPTSRTLTGDQAERAVALARWAQLSTLKVLTLGRREAALHRARKLRQTIMEYASNSVSLRDLERRHNYSREEIRSLVTQFPRWFEMEKHQTGGRPSEMVHAL